MYPSPLIPVHLSCLTHFILNEFFCHIYRKSHFQCKGCEVMLFLLENANNLQNSGDLDQMPHYVASDLVLHVLPIAF